MVAFIRSFVATSSVTILIVGLVAACTPSAAPTPTAAPSKPTVAASPAASPAKPSSASSPATTAPAKASPQASSQAEWDKTLAAAKQEGKVVVYGPPGDQVRRTLADEFQKAYGIPVDFWGVATGGQLTARAMNERQAGQYVNDVFVFGAVDLWGPMRPALAPLEPNLILPEVKDKQYWSNWEFADNDGKYVFSMQLTVGNLAVINTGLVKPEELKSLNNLLDSKWKGKIVLADPRIAGQGEYSLSTVYDFMGEQFMSRLLKEQQPTVSGDVGQIADWLAHGRFPIAISAGNTLIQPYIDQGIPIQGNVFSEGSYQSSSYYNLAMADRAPHPNAAKVYVNWLLGKDGQTKISVGAGTASARTDVPTDHLPKAAIPVKGVRYFEPHLEKNKQISDKVKAMFDEVFGK